MLMHVPDSLCTICWAWLWANIFIVWVTSQAHQSWTSICITGFDCSHFFVTFWACNGFSEHCGRQVEEGSFAYAIYLCFTTACDCLQFPLVILAWVHQFYTSCFDALEADWLFTHYASFRRPWAMWVVVFTCCTVVFWYFVFITMQALVIFVLVLVCWAAQALDNAETGIKQRFCIFVAYLEQSV